VISLRSIHASRYSRWLVASTALAVFGSCAEDDAKLAGSEKPVVYGEDDRQDVYAYGDQAWAARAAEFSAAMIPDDAIDASDPSNVVLVADTLTEAYGVCSDERFGPQLTAAYCSATLIAPDLVLTAGHCITASSCANFNFVFDYYMTGESALHPLTADDVYPCAQVVVRAQTSTPRNLDYAIVRLDRPVVGRTPATVDVSPTALPAATPITVNGYGSGLPLKIDDGASVRDPRAASTDYFIANLDTFGGNSGSGVFRQDSGALVGILVRGETDYVQDPSGCTRVNRCPDTGCRGEDSTYAYNAVDALCDAGPHPTLCACGDGTCDGGIGETTATCPADCGTSCGDGVCNGTESPNDCTADCGTCGNGVCDAGDTQANCCTDCGCAGEGDVCQANVCIPDPGPGDVCAAALEIEATGTQTLTNTTVTAQNDYAGSCIGGSANDRVYTFTVTRPTLVEAISTGYDTGLYLRSTCDDTSTELACNDDSTPPGGLGSRIQSELDAGTYYLFVDGYASNAGAYTLTVSFSLNCTDTDGDGACDEEDECPEDPGKVEAGQCGCGVADTDTDGDGLADCKDECPEDPAKEEGGQCGCGVPDTDTDGDGLADCKDACPEDPAKEEPGVCGCGTADTDTDGDGALDCQEACDEDPAKTEPGICGCGTADTDTDGDGTADCLDACAEDPAKTEPGACGCGVPDTDTDGDGTADCVDACPADPAKTEPGVCGCGTADTNMDADEALDCQEECDTDPTKTEPGVCGCGTPDTDGDGDGSADCVDSCPADPGKTEPGTCGCGVADTDSDGDGQANCVDECPSDPTNRCDEPPPDDGCGCRSTSNSSTATGLLMIGLVAVGLRRRRRRA
jgi:MYXO-CTERM domain-containing protein